MRRSITLVAIPAAVLAAAIALAALATPATVITLPRTIPIVSDHVDGLAAAAEIREVLARYDCQLEVEIVYGPDGPAEPRIRVVKLAHATAR